MQYQQDTLTLIRPTSCFDKPAKPMMFTTTKTKPMLLSASAILLVRLG
ncbi:hypothetical protein VIBHAR_04818 [Vibrio campbellii ATCC BAA-1116]|uniref:Uncharacterized protein n=1 Tax=Vibrio campbellii (strain ATCC BAA-1116) TaxID=2902295 RepID=A7N5S4_VIBC1|nr:hypothetical protein VIBHAR_04818 [Vibrio campbellii ATCC BAA-1116]